jgi:hypothetical protein
MGKLGKLGKLGETFRWNVWKLREKTKGIILWRSSKDKMR